MIKNRLLLGWVNDNSPIPLAGKPWPIIDLSPAVVETYREFIPFASEAGFKAITIWGLYISHSWPVSLMASDLDDRRKFLDPIVELADQHGMSIIHGFGAYGWGFEEIIRKDPSCARNEGRRVWGSVVNDNGLVMCYHEPSARDWMRRVIDLVVTDLGASGISLQAGDLGRCYCHQCREMNDLEYFARVVNETASYARSLKPDLLIGHSCWGVELKGLDDSFKKLTQNLNFLTDVSDDLAKQGSEYRKHILKLVQPCAVGSLGGAVIVPPQRWNRDRWFLPHARYSHERIRQLANDGAGAFEFFFGPLANPQYKLMTEFIGRILSRPHLGLNQALDQSVAHLFQPIHHGTESKLAQVCLDVEEAYFQARGYWPLGEFDFEPLKTEVAGPPIYLEAIPRERRPAYKAKLECAHLAVSEVAPHFRQSGEVQLIAECLGNTLLDLESLG